MATKIADQIGSSKKQFQKRIERIGRRNEGRHQRKKPRYIDVGRLSNILNNILFFKLIAAKVVNRIGSSKKQFQKRIERIGRRNEGRHQRKKPRYINVWRLSVFKKINFKRIDGYKNSRSNRIFQKNSSKKESNESDGVTKAGTDEKSRDTSTQGGFQYLNKIIYEYQMATKVANRIGSSKKQFPKTGERIGRRNEGRHQRKKLRYIDVWQLSIFK